MFLTNWNMEIVIKKCIFCMEDDQILSLKKLHLKKHKYLQSTPSD